MYYTWCLDINIQFYKNIFFSSLFSHLNSENFTMASKFIVERMRPYGTEHVNRTNSPTDNLTFRIVCCFFTIFEISFWILFTFVMRYSCKDLSFFGNWTRLSAKKHYKMDQIVLTIESILNVTVHQSFIVREISSLPKCTSQSMRSDRKTLNRYV